MANYQNIVNACRDAVPEGVRFIHARLVDFSNKYTGSYPLITLLNFIVNDFRSNVNSTFDTTTLVVGFLTEDSVDSTEEQRENLLNDMDILANTFISNLLENNNIKLSNIVKEPVFQFYQGTLSGFFVNIQISIIAPC